MVEFNRAQKGFTIVELLIVVVVIAILAAITIVAYSGIQDNARKTALQAEMKQRADKIKLYALDNQVFPDTLAQADIETTAGNTTFQYTKNDAGDNFCLTGLYNNSFALHQSDNGLFEDGPCDGHSGGTQYCPTDTHVPINGFFCEGNEGSVAVLNTSAVKLSSTTAGVPPGAPAPFVGRQTSRDNLVGSPFSISEGDQYCMEGWVSTTDSTVTHAIGLQYSGGTGGTATTWHGFGSAATPANATNQWIKIGGCRTVPTNFPTARFWTQNNGSAGGTASPAWYQTAIRFWKP